MKSPIFNIFYLAQALLSFLFNYYSQKQYLNKFKPIQNFLKESNYNLSARDRYRIKDYSIRLYVLLGINAKLLTGHKINPSERKYLTLLGAFAPLYDDFIDHTKPEIIKLKILVKDPSYFIPVNIKEKIGSEILKLLLDYSKKKTRKLFPIIYKSHLSQIQSQKQKQQNISIDESTNISYTKGGFSALLCRYMIDVPLSKEEYEAWFQYGAFLQVLDDIFDIRTDIQSGIKTFANSTTNINDIESILDSQLNKAIGRIFLTSYPKKNKSRFIYRILLLYIAGKTMVMRLKKIKKEQGDEFNFSALSKKKLELNTWSISNLIYMLKLAGTLNINTLTDV